jgi:thioredoxin-related protein
MIKKQLLPFLFALISIAGLAQSPGGMDFIKAGSWEEVKAKAKAENKYIFLDGYTTWCGPCIMMAKKIFPLPEVGEFYNANFINVKVQLDTTSYDNEHVKQWYKDGNFLMTTYGIRAFPTYLFFSPDGEIVHRAVGSSDGETFIGKGKDALNPDKQYYSLARQFNQGNRDPEFIKKLLTASQAAYDRQNLPVYSQAYFATQSNLLTEENMKLLADLTESSKDTGFVLMQKNAAAFNKALGKPGEAETRVIEIILRENVYPKLSDGSELATVEPDWNAMKKMLKGKYPEFGEAAVLRGQIMYFKAKDDFPKFAAAVSELLGKYERTLSPEMLNGFAWAIFESCNDAKCIAQALNWSKKSIEGKNDPMLIDTYANLLHKTGNTAEAIKWQKKAIELLKSEGEDTEDFEDTLAKMEKGEKTW